MSQPAEPLVLFADPHAIPDRLAILAGVVPASVIGLLKQQVLSLALKTGSAP